MGTHKCRWRSYHPHFHQHSFRWKRIFRRVFWPARRQLCLQVRLSILIHVLLVGMDTNFQHFFKNRLTADTAHQFQMQGFANGDLSLQPIQFSGKYVTLSFLFFKGSSLNWLVYPLALRTSCSSVALAVMQAVTSLMAAQSPTSRPVSAWRMVGMHRRSHWPHALAHPTKNTTSIHPNLLVNIFGLQVAFSFARTILVIILFFHHCNP